ncbi:MAG: RNA polymerase sigma factor RpoD/SigA [Deltaproteobacteria bacterium]|nr:RNA polymerase sigma factor RpoD/SigA [Deltaproteobacteria bacterium]
MLGRTVTVTKSKKRPVVSKMQTGKKDSGIGKGSGYPMPYKMGTYPDAPEGKPVSGLFREAKPAREHEGPVPARESIKIYFGSIKRFKLLTQEDEIRLARKISRGDTGARDAMISSNLRLVVNIARRYLNRGLSFEDLIEEGNLGLIKAVERFKATKGCRFSTYATFWIKQTVERALANQSNTVRLPIHISTDLYKVTRASKELLAILHREPDLSEIAQKTGFSGRYVKKLDTISRKSLSLESLTHENSDHTLLDRLEDDRFPTPERSLEDSDRVEKIRKLLGILDESERTILKLRFGFDHEEPHTLEEIGNSFGVTRERVRQIECKALGKLRDLARRADISSMEHI